MPAHGTRKEPKQPGLAPAQIVTGRVQEAEGRLLLRLNGIAIELLTAVQAPSGAAALNAARLATLEALAGWHGRSATVYGRQQGEYLLGTRLVGSFDAVPDQPEERELLAEVERQIERHRNRLLQLPGVLDLRPGYRFRGGWITGEPCIVATVHRKLDKTALAPNQQLPREVGGIGIDVVPATPLEQALAAAGLRPDSLSGEAARLLLIATPRAMPPLEAGPLAAAAPQPGYVPPPDVRLDAVSGPVELVCHLSPDAGWPTLRAFLGGVRERLTVAMYDFTAPHVLTAIQAAAAATAGAGGSLRLILDPNESRGGAGDPDNPKAGDLDEDAVTRELHTQLGSRFAFTWAAVKVTGKTTGELFPSAYHIKLAVRDGRAFWLSSGNWQSSNQPPIDPLGEHASLLGVHRRYNREWHVLVKHEGLARTLERFVQWDAEQALPLNGTAAPAPALPDLVVDRAGIEPLVATPPVFFAPKRVRLRGGDWIQPLLTPDNYAEHVLALIERAGQRLWLQNQYIKIGAGIASRPPKFRALLEALRSKQRQPGIDVRIILRDIGNTRAMIEALHANGFDTNPERMRVQKGSHTKGIVVDGDLVLIGSHNWSGDGTVLNRDASLIVRNAEAASYYAAAFEHDWERLARPFILAERAMPMLAGSETELPEGKSRVPWVAMADAEERAALGALAETLPSLRRAEAVRFPEPAVARSALAPLSAVIAGSTASPRRAGRGLTADLLAAKAMMVARYLDIERPRAVPFGAAAAPSPRPEHNVVGVALGEKISENQPTGVASVRLLVRRKYPKNVMSLDEMLPTHVQGIPVDVQEVGEVRPLVDLPDPCLAYTPARPGCSVGFDAPMAGTFGARVVGPDGRRYILSNNHVLADLGRLPAGAPIFQAGLLDLAPTASRRQIARLARWSDFNAVPLLLDCAIAEEISQGNLAGEILHVGLPAGVGQAAEDMIVHKYGRTTRYTVGRVTSIAATIEIPYVTGLYRFDDQIQIEGVGTAFAAAGDSGSLIVERQSATAVGLLFGGSEVAVFANHIGDVLTAMRVTLG